MVRPTGSERGDVSGGREAGRCPSDDRARWPDLLCDPTRADSGPGRRPASGAWAVLAVVWTVALAVPAMGSEGASVESPPAAIAPTGEVVVEATPPHDPEAGPAPSRTSSSETGPVYWTSFGLLTVTDVALAMALATLVVPAGLLGPLAAVSAVVVLAGGAAVVPVVAWAAGGRHGVSWTPVAFVAGGVVAAFVTTAGTALGGFIILFVESAGPPNIPVMTTGAVVVATAVLGGAAIGATLPTFTVLAGPDANPE